MAGMPHSKGPLIALALASPDHPVPLAGLSDGRCKPQLRFTAEELPACHARRLACQPAIAGQETGEREPFTIGEGGLNGNQGSGSGSSGHRHLPAG